MIGRVPVLAWAALVAEVDTIGEIMFVDNRTSVEALRTQDEFQCLAHCGLPDVVSADQQGVLVEDHTSLCDSAEVIDLKLSDPHVMAFSSPDIVIPLESVALFYRARTNTSEMTSSASLPSLRTLPPYQPADMARPEWSRVPVALVRQVRAWIRSRRQAESSWILWRIGYAGSSGLSVGGRVLVGGWG